MEPSTKKRKYSKLYCPHSEIYVSKSTWYSHHGQFFDSRTKQWMKVAHNKAETANGAATEFNFGRNSEHNDEVSGSSSNYFDQLQESTFNPSSAESEDKVCYVYSECQVAGLFMNHCTQ